MTEACSVSDRQVDHLLRNAQDRPAEATALRARSPALSVRPNFRVEGPGPLGLMGEMPDLVGDIRGLDEEVVRLVRTERAGPFQVDHGIDDEIGDMNAFWTELARHRLRQDPLG